MFAAVARPGEDFYRLTSDMVPVNPRELIHEMRDALADRRHAVANAHNQTIRHYFSHQVLPALLVSDILNLFHNKFP